MSTIEGDAPDSNVSDGGERPRDQYEQQTQITWGMPTVSLTGRRPGCYGCAIALRDPTVASTVSSNWSSRNGL